MKTRVPTRLFEAVVRPMQHFLRLEASSGIILFASAAIALGWANSRWADRYRDFTQYPLTIGFGATTWSFTLLSLVNEGLMTIFFFVVGMEIKRELVSGELRTVRRALLPAIAAVGGMAVPAAIYLAFNAGTPGAPGWGIPMATDIAFCIGLLTLLKSRVPHALVVFVTALAIFDDIGGILVIAFFYGHGLELGWLAAAAVTSVALFGANRIYARNGLVYATLGGILWYALHHGGIHATISGVILGLMIPARPKRPAREVLGELRNYTAALASKAPDEDLENAEILSIEEKLEDMEPPLQRFVHLLHPYVAFLIMPLFALTNSGVALQAESAIGRIMLGAALGLLVGKALGIFSFTYVALRFGLSPMPGNVGLTKLFGVSIIAGIGFTVALFIAALAFPGAPALLDEAKLGILIGSFAAGVLGAIALLLTPRLRERADA